ncbi:phosphoglycerate mutase [Alloscardovia macacae]|uniref:Phosphoglycerate mutase n=1 Tax=Alloscardovia macacae TaxID=1160091 RepID=A0A1Y2T104_9BIFI|nr:histidine phosphatase family protein [Alloscardovia macacae]OTA25837.1 phosphoglycerate mutase [Alloscardovia macacae]OTA28682.1 phosphoglycerate mutase [Alloscardovia macacae]
MTTTAPLNDITSTTQGKTNHARFITLVRHGRTRYNAENRLQGQIDIPLDEVGRWQIQQTAAELRRLYVSSEGAEGGESGEGRSVEKPLVVTSTLGRAQETAHAFADVLGVPVHVDDRVKERGFGELEGMPVTEMQKRWPEDFESWRNFGDGELSHGAEPKAEVGRRGAEAVDEWAHTVDSDTQLFVFSHGAWINQVVNTLMGWSEFHSDFADLVSMRNAFWTRLMLFDMPDGSERYRLVDYAHGPVAAYTQDWDNPEV